MIRFAQQLQTLGRIFLFQNAADRVIGLAAALDILAPGRIEHLDVLAILPIEPGARLLAQCSFIDQCL